MAVQVQLSRDLVEEILILLPSQSLLRFKCVSKQWNLLFSNQGFIHRHMKTRSSLHPHQHFFQRRDFTLSIATPHNNGEDGIQFQPVKTKPQDLLIKHVVGHCNGLLCVHDHSTETGSRSFVVWNPSTNEQQTIPVPDKLPWGKGIREYYGFGYDSTTDDYKIVLVTTSFHKIAKIQSMGLKKYSWEVAQNNAQNLPQRYCDLSSLYAIHVNGYLYWVFRKRGSGNRYDGIASFDLRRNRMREEESLSEKLLGGKRHIALNLLEDSLCMMETDDKVNFNAWIMKENEVTETKSWIKIFRVSTKHSVFTPLRDRLSELRPICFTGNGKVIIVASNWQDFIVYDPKDESFKKAASCGCGSTDSSFFCFPLTPSVESLVSPGKTMQVQDDKSMV